MTYFGGDEASGLGPDLEAKEIWMKLGVTESRSVILVEVELGPERELVITLVPKVFLFVGFHFRTLGTLVSEC